MRKPFALLLVLVLTAAPFMFVAKSELSSAESFENSWTAKEPMSQARPCVGVAVVNGKIYAIGGSRNHSINEEYDPATDKWTTKQPMPTARYNFGIAVYNNKIYCFGGQYNSDPMSKTILRDAIEVYDPATDTWETKTPLAIPRTQLQANTVDGKIYLMGGKTGGQLSTVSLNEAYDPETESWTTKTPLQYPVSSSSSVTIGNSIYLLGGQDESSAAINLAVNQIYNTETDTWSLGSPIPVTVYRSAAGVTSGIFAPQRIYLAGGHPGEGTQATDIVQVYDPLTDIWSSAASMPSKRMYLAVAVIDDRLYAIGGASHYYFWPGPESTAENSMYTPIGHIGSSNGTSPSAPTPSTTTPTPTNTPDSFPVAPTAVVAMIIAISAGLLLLHTKRRKTRNQFS